MSFKRMMKNPLFAGEQVGNFMRAATATLTTAFILNAGTFVYQLQQLVLLLLSLAVGMYISKKAERVKNIAIKNFKLMMTIEAIINGIVGILVMIIGDEAIYIVIIVTAVLLPFSKVQEIGIIALTNNYIKDRATYDILKAAYAPYTYVAGTVAGFLLNSTISGSTAFALTCFAEVLNNRFYIKAYNEINATATTATVEEAA
jgi:hypothetical protein